MPGCERRANAVAAEPSAALRSRLGPASQAGQLEGSRRVSGGFRDEEHSACGGDERNRTLAPLPGGAKYRRGVGTPPRCPRSCCHAVEIGGLHRGCILRLPADQTNRKTGHASLSELSRGYQFFQRTRKWGFGEPRHHRLALKQETGGIGIHHVADGLDSAARNLLANRPATPALLSASRSSVSATAGRRVPPKGHPRSSEFPIGALSVASSRIEELVRQFQVAMPSSAVRNWTLPRGARGGCPPGRTLRSP